jgi:hypothetical protein
METSQLPSQGRLKILHAPSAVIFGGTRTTFQLFIGA